MYIYVYCCVCHVLKMSRYKRVDIHPNWKNHEVITMEIDGKFFSIDTDKGIW